MNKNEPVIGEIRKGKDIGYSGYVTSRSIFIFMACESCGTKRWVKLEHGKPRGVTEGKICKKCAVRIYGKNKAGKGSSAWNGGRALTTDGYVNIYLEPDDFFYPMANESHYVREHRLVMAKSLGRCLHEWEVVHHKGIHFPMNSIENKSDNNLENLQLVTDQKHAQITILENRIAYLKRKNRELQEENKKLKAELKKPK